MKKLILFFIVLSTSLQAQLLMKPLNTQDQGLPEWAKLMYSEHPNIYEVEKLHDAYYLVHEEESTPYIAYYKHWRRYVQPFIQEDGFIHIPDLNERRELRKISQQASTSASRMLSPWQFAGPESNYRARYSASDPVSKISWHANMYCIDQSLSNPDVLYAGGENGGVYKSSDKGLHWIYISRNEDMTSVSSVAVNPANENDVLVNSDGKTYRSTDGGTTWSMVGSAAFQARNITIWQFMYNPSNTNLVYAGGDDSLYRSTDAGLTWNGVFGGECQSVAVKPGNNSVVYAMQYNSFDKIAYFTKSLDSGLTFTPKPNGWFTVPVVDAGLIQSYGGRIAVTEADSERVYVLLVGESQSTAQLQLHGQIGIYRSNDAGENWTNPHVIIGSPYNQTTHPNMMSFNGDDNTYNQIYYNTSLIVSQLNADRILIGGMSLWRSDDAAASFQPVGGYIGAVANIHPDNQELKVYKTSPTTEEVWFANDGGINYSVDFVQTQESRCQGLYGAAFWGFDQGWNDDIMVGGRYHNGNAATRDGYPQGDYQQLGGGEAATGYVNYSNEKKTYFSDIDGVILPDTLNGVASRFGVTEDPNESYVDNSSSRIMFDWDYWNVAYLGKDNKILISRNGGSSFGELFSFGTNAASRVYWIEQSRVDKNVMYAQQVVSNISRLWKSVDRGISWAQVTLPQSKRELNFTLSGTDANEVWISFPGGTNGNKVYHSINGGASWSNITMPSLNGFQIKSMAHQFATDGGVYLGTYHGPVFYKNNSMPDWVAVGSDLPFISYPLRLVPFYRDNKIRLATWHLGIWETSLYENSALIADFSANYEEYYCPGDTIKFVPHCVASSNATYQWTFTGATPATSTAMYPEVVYQSTGSFDVSLIVSDNGTSDTLTKTGFIKTSSNGSLPLQEGFESGNYDASWKIEGTGNGNSNWAIKNTAGAFGQSTYSLQNDNWSFDAQGARDAIRTAKYDFTNLVGGWLRFDVAYALYGGIYSDTLEIRVSTDCGVNFTSIYLNGGQLLATAPNNSSAAFLPTSSQWRTDSVDISFLSGNPEVFFSIENLGHFGQILYLDNINLQTLMTSIPDEAKSINVSVYPNPFHDEFSIIVDSKDEMEFTLYDAGLKKILDKQFVSTVITDMHDLTPGVYFYQIRGKNGLQKAGKLIKN